MLDRNFKITLIASLPLALLSACGPEPTPRPPPLPSASTSATATGSSAAQTRPAVRTTTLGSHGYRHSSRVADLVIAANGQSLVTRVAAVRKAKLTAVALWSTATQKRRLQRIGSAFAYIEGGAQIALEQGRGQLALFSASSGALETKLAETTARVGVMAAPPDGRWLASGDEQGVVRLWSLAKGGKKGAAAGGGPIEPVERSRSNGSVLALAAAVDGASLVVAWDGHVEVLSTKAEDLSGSLVVHLPGLKGGSAALQLSSDGSRLLVSNVNPAAQQRAESRAKIYELPSGSLLRELSQLHDARLLPKGDKILVSRKAGRVAIVDPKKARDIKRFDLGTPATAAIAVSPAGDRMAAVAGAELRVWDGSGAELHRFSLKELVPSRLAFGPEGKLLYLAHSQAVRVWDLEKAAERLVATGHVGALRAVALSTDARIAVTGGDDGTARIWNATEGRQLAVLAGHLAPVGAVAIAPGNLWAATASYQGIVRIWDLKTHGLLHDLVGHQRTWPVEALAFSSDGSRLASGSAYSEAKIWDVATGELLQSIDWRIAGAKPCAGSAPCADVKMTTTRVHTLRFVGEQQEQLLSVSLAGAVEKWDLASGKQLGQLGQLGEMVATSFSEDGKVMLAVTRDRKLHRVVLPEGNITTLSLEGAPRASGIAFVTGGFATAHVDGRLRLWSLDADGKFGSSDPLAIVETRSGAALALASGGRGRKLLVGQQNSTATVWRLRRF